MKISPSPPAVVFLRKDGDLWRVTIVEKGVSNEATFQVEHHAQMFADGQCSRLGLSTLVIGYMHAPEHQHRRTFQG